MRKNEICEIKGEQHYVWPMRDFNDCRASCGQCGYYKPHSKPSPHWDGECTSVAQNTARGYLHRANGNDYVNARSWCKYFFPASDLEEQLRMEAPNG